MSLWRIHTSFSETTLKQTVTASIITFIKRQTSMHRAPLSPSDLNVIILEYTVLQRAFELHFTELSYIDIDPLFSRLSASQDIVAALLLKRIKKCGSHRVRQGQHYHLRRQHFTVIASYSSNDSNATDIIRKVIVRMPIEFQDSITVNSHFPCQSDQCHHSFLIYHCP